LKHLIDEARQETKQSPPSQSCHQTPQTYKQKSNYLHKTAATKSSVTTKLSEEHSLSDFTACV